MAHSTYSKINQNLHESKIKKSVREANFDPNAPVEDKSYKFLKDFTNSVGVLKELLYEVYGNGWLTIFNEPFNDKTNTDLKKLYINITGIDKPFSIKEAGGAYGIGYGNVSPGLINLYDDAFSTFGELAITIGAGLKFHDFNIRHTVIMTKVDKMRQSAKVIKWYNEWYY